MRSQGVECPECGGMFTRVVHSNLDIENNRVRARVCQDCKHKFSTVELAVPGLSHARTQRSHSQRARVRTPQYVNVKRREKGMTLSVLGPFFDLVCRKRLHDWIPENIYTSPSTGRQTCRPCRSANARERYHHARRNAPESILEDQRRYWREKERRRRAA